MEIKRSGSQPSNKGPADWFTGSVRIDPLSSPPDPSRVACAFETAGGLPVAMVLVGALFVGSIATRWHGEVAPARPRRPLELPAPTPARPLAKGEEMGHFNMGSTVILLFPRDAVTWLPELAAASRIRMGQPLARLLASG